MPGIRIQKTQIGGDLNIIIASNKDFLNQKFSEFIRHLQKGHTSSLLFQKLEEAGLLTDPIRFNSLLKNSETLFNSSPIRSDKNQLQKQYIVNKLNADFDDSFLYSNQNILYNYKESIKLLKSVKLIATTLKETRILKDEIPIIGLTVLDAKEIAAYVSALKPIKTIHVSCTSIHPATVSVFKSLANRLSLYQIKLIVSYESINGRTQVAQSKNNDFDFAVFPNDAFFMSVNATETNYRLLFPIHGQTQYLFHRKSKDKGKKNRIYFYADSSAHMHQKLGKGIPAYSEKKKLETVDNISQFITTMTGGDIIIVWEPLANALRQHPDFEQMPASDYRIYNSLYCHKNWTLPIMSSALDAFKNLFVNEWRYCNVHRRRAIEFLIQDESYPEYFALGAGINFSA